MFVARSCEHCGGFTFTLPDEDALYRSTVVSFLDECGVDVTERPLWELRVRLRHRADAGHGEDPWRIGVTIRCEGDEVEVVVGGTSGVVDVVED